MVQLWRSGDPRPRFSVVVPALDEEAVLGACLDSLLAQDHPGTVEVIVVDNGSSDGTAAVARSRGVTVLEEPVAGVCAARERGRREAAGEVVVSTDADTAVGPGWLSAIDERMKADPGVVAVAGPCRFVDAPAWGAAWQWLLFGVVAVVARLTGRVVYATATNLAFRAESFDGYDLRLTQGGDELDVLRRVRRHGRVAFAPDNPTFTSSRRLRRGFVYNLVVTLGFYYLLGYALNRVLGRPLLGTAPAFRPRPTTPARTRALLASVAAGLVLVAFGVGEHEGLF